MSAKTLFLTKIARKGSRGRPGTCVLETTVQSTAAALG